MAGWLETAADELGVAPLERREIDALLDLARDVAHGTERRYAPLTAFLLGVHVGAGASRSEAVDRAAQQLRATLPQDL